jgi:hypothetical protein
MKSHSEVVGLGLHHRNVKERSIEPITPNYAGSGEQREGLY